MNDIESDISQGGAPVGGGGFVETALPARKRLDHRGPLSIDVSGAWYFITICAAERVHYGRAVSMKPPPTPFMNHADEILEAARFRHANGKWFLALFLIMPDHIHLIVHVPSVAAVSSKPPYRTGDAAVSSKPPYRCGLEYVIGDFKRWLSAKCGLRFQRDFWDTRLRDPAHYDEKFRYICGNPVRKGICATPRDWPYVIAFDRVTGEERPHRGVHGRGVGGTGGFIETALPKCVFCRGIGRAVSMKPPPLVRSGDHIEH